MTEPPGRDEIAHIGWQQHVCRKIVGFPFVVRLGFDKTLVVVEGELRVDRDQLARADDRIDPFAGVERVLDGVGARREPVPQQVLEQQLAEAAARLRRP